MKNQPYPGLCLSRALGDTVAASIGVIAEPDVTTYTITEDDIFVIICSDGVWEFMDNDEVVNLINNYTKDNLKEAVDKLA